MPSNLIRSAIFASVAAAMPLLTSPAHAIDFLPSADAGPVSWSGWIVNPDIGFESMSFSGSGGALLNDADGYYAGGFIGRDFEFGPLVVGASANIAYSWMEGGGRAPDTLGLETQLNWFGLVKARAGAGLGRFLIYGTAGYAYGDLEIESRLFGQSASETLSGTALGGGGEFRWNSDMSLRIEYLTIDFEEAEFKSLPAGSRTVDPQMEIWKVGFVKRF